MMSADQSWMVQALDLARSVCNGPDVPIAALVVRADEVIATAVNEREAQQDPTAHAEVLAISRAAHKLNDWRLSGCCIYVTLEPCPMCAGAIVMARPQRLVFGAWNDDYGAVGSQWDLPRDRRLNHRPEVRGGVLEGETQDLLTQYFAAQRERRSSLL